jgi:hypothetical protein
MIPGPYKYVINKARVICLNLEHRKRIAGKPSAGSDDHDVFAGEKQRRPQRTAEKLKSCYSIEK